MDEVAKLDGGDEIQVIPLEDSRSDAAPQKGFKKFNPFSRKRKYTKWFKSSYVTYIKPRMPRCTEALSQRSWVVLHCLLGTLDVLLNVKNFLYFTSDNLKEGLVIGPIPSHVWAVLSFFTGVSMILFFLETANTLSALCRKNHQLLVPIHIEMLVTLSAEHIPLAAINYFICTCRQNYTTWWQFACGACRIFYLCLRLLWHAHMQGIQIKSSEKQSLHTPFVLSVLGLLAIASSFPVQSWKVGPPPHLEKAQMNNVSILWFRETPFLTNVKFEHFPAYTVMHKPKFKVYNPILVPTLTDIWQSGNSGITVNYTCPDFSNMTVFCPNECNRSQTIQFKFIFKDTVPSNPYGAIYYNFALLSTLSPSYAPSSDNNGSTTCVPSAGDLDKWRLSYVAIEKYKPEDIQYTNLTSPHHWSCVLPSPVYDNTIQICDNSPDFNISTSTISFADG